MSDTGQDDTLTDEEFLRWIKQLKDLASAELLQLALLLSKEDYESEKHWHVLYTLRARGDEETLNAVQNWCSSNNLVERELTADFLSLFSGVKDENGNTVYPVIDTVLPLLESLLDDPEVLVVSSAIYSLGNYDAFDAILARPSLSENASVDVRLAVACSLGLSESKNSIDILIALSNDQDGETRNWAIFGLGSQCHFDTQEIREALYQRMDDPHIEARCEALVGLAVRKDVRVIPYIEKALRAKWVGELVM